MTDKEIFEKVRKIVYVQLSMDDPKEIVPAADFMHLGAGSMDLIELRMALEEEFDMEVTDEVAENITTIQDVLDVIKQKFA